ncbi:MAG: nuclear transport factor 2 family protein [Cytophagaceae bacterium]|nr:nuclear transport factor 2 family protein [Cytophagaceae bacterium]
MKTIQTFRFNFPTRLHVFLGLSLVVLLTSCTKKEVNVQELNQQFIGAWNNKDSDKVISLLADDVHFLQGSLHLNGKSEVAQGWVRSTLPTISDLKTNVVTSAADDKTAYQAGTFSVDVLPATPNEPHGFGEGNFILLWKKGADNTWKLSYAQLEDLPVQAKSM